MRVAHLCTLYIAPRWRGANAVPTDDDDTPEPYTTNQQYPIRQEFCCPLTRTGPHPWKQQTSAALIADSTRLRDPEYVPS